MPSLKAIAAANAALVETLDLGGEPCRVCWACSKPGTPQRAHVVARANGGTDEPGNYLLLCRLCHSEQPDGMPREVQEQWLRDRETAMERIVRLGVAIGSELVAISPDHIAAYSFRVRDDLKVGAKRTAGTTNAIANAREWVKRCYADLVRAWS